MGGQAGLLLEDDHVSARSFFEIGAGGRQPDETAPDNGQLSSHFFPPAQQDCTRRVRAYILDESHEGETQQ